MTVLVPRTVLIRSDAGTYQVPRHRLSPAGQVDILADQPKIQKLMDDNPDYSFMIHQEGVSRVVRVSWRKRK